MGLLDLIKRDKKNTNPSADSSIPVQNINAFTPAQSSLIPGAQNSSLLNAQMTPQPVQNQMTRPQSYDRNLAQAPVDPTPVQQDYGYDSTMQQTAPTQPSPTGFVPAPVSNMQSVQPMPMSNPAPVFEQIPVPNLSPNPEQISQRLDQPVQVQPEPTPSVEFTPVTETPVPEQTQPLEVNAPSQSFDMTPLQPVQEIQESVQNIIEPPVNEVTSIEEQQINQLPNTEPEIPSALDIPSAEEPVSNVAESSAQTEVIIGTQQPENQQASLEVNNIPDNTQEVTTDATDSLNQTDSTQTPNPSVNQTFDFSNLDFSNLQVAPLASPEIPQTAQPAQTVQEQSDQTPSPVHEVPIQETAPKSSLLFETIALLGLEGPYTDMQMVEPTKNLVRELIQREVHVVVDSKHGLGQPVMQTLTEQNAEFTAVYLQPFISKVSAGVNESLVQNPATVFLYSHYLEKLSFIIKQSECFVVFDSGGITNLQQFVTLWTIASMYESNRKPIVLVGNAWHQKLDQLATLLQIPVEEKAKMTIVDSPDIVLQKLEELSTIDSISRNLQSFSIIDRRIEGDESDFII